MARKKIQKNFNFPREIVEWFEDKDASTGARRSRMAIACALAYELQSHHVQRFCMLLATAIEAQGFTMDEALAMLRIENPAVMAAPASPGGELDFDTEYRIDRFMRILVDEWNAFLKAGAPPGGKGSRDLLRKREQVFAEERWKDAEARLRAASKLPKEPDEPKKPRKKKTSIPDCA